MEGQVIKKILRKKNLFNWNIDENRVYYKMEGYGDSMRDSVLDNIKEYNLISKGDTIIVGVSGGLDSMALLVILNELKDELDFNIVVCHVNHGVREEAVDDQEFVRKVANNLGLEFHTRNVDMVSYGKKMGITAEEAGRDLRYGFFREIRKKVPNGKIAVAHNKNDQAETLLQRLMRGTGIHGLQGMEFKTLDIIRPILNISRDEIEEYLEENNIGYVVDRTNLLPIYNRNKVRLELIPYIEKNFNPNIVNTLWRTSQTANIDSSYLEQTSMDSYNHILKEENTYRIILDGSKFKKNHRSIQNRIVRYAILRLIQTIQGLSEYHISSLVDMFLELQTGKKIDLPNELIGRVSYNDLIIEKRQILENIHYDFNLTMGINTIRTLDSIIEINLVDKFDCKEDSYIKYIDYHKIKGNLSLRNRRNGDRITPLGMNGSKKVKDYFIDKKIPREYRDEIPLLVDNENIIWIVGHGLSNLYRVTKSTEKILEIKYTGGLKDA